MQSNNFTENIILGMSVTMGTDIYYIILTSKRIELEWVIFRIHR